MVSGIPAVSITQNDRFLSCDTVLLEVQYDKWILTPWSRVLLEKLTGSQLVKKFPAFYGTWGFITTFTSARHLSLSWTTFIQSIPPHSTSWRSILILASHLCLGLQMNMESKFQLLSDWCLMTVYHIYVSLMCVGILHIAGKIEG
jgi:hypothetical protein